MTAPALDSAARAAIRWMVLLDSGEASDREREGFDTWLQQDARHRIAWQHLNGTVAQSLGRARALNLRAPGQANAMADAISDAKAGIQKRRRVLRGALALGGVGAGSAALLQRFHPIQGTFADFRTATGQRERYALADGSVLLLNARSAADVHLTPSRRQVSLRMGAVIASVKPDPSRPFVLATAWGEIQPRDADRQTRLLVRQQAQGCVVAALDEALRVTPKRGTQTQLASGDTLWLSEQDAVPTSESAASAAAWEAGRIAVYDRPLGEVIEAMRAYRPGLLRISPDAAALKVYGSYPLDDTDAALQSIAETLPVSVHVHSGGWLVRIELA